MVGLTWDNLDCHRPTVSPAPGMGPTVSGARGRAGPGKGTSRVGPGVLSCDCKTEGRPCDLERRLALRVVRIRGVQPGAAPPVLGGPPGVAPPVERVGRIGDGPGGVDALTAGRATGRSGGVRGGAGGAGWGGLNGGRGGTAPGRRTLKQATRRPGAPGTTPGRRPSASRPRVGEPDTENIRHQPHPSPNMMRQKYTERSGTLVTLRSHLSHSPNHETGTCPPVETTRKRFPDPGR